jgi:phosphoglycerate dehydrogenase-like enzyme
VPIICFPSEDLKGRVVRAADSPDTVGQGCVLESFAELPDGLGDVEFWVPGFLGGAPATPAELRRLMPALRVIQAQSAGVDVFLSIVPDGVVLCDGRGVHGSSTSEWALTAILSVLREFPRFERAQREHFWDRVMTDELAGKRVLIVGSGDVGTQLKRRIEACDAHAVMVARTARDGIHPIGELPNLLPGADVVVLIVPQTSETIGMVDSAFLSGMSDGALLVNAARGPVVRTEALLAELTSGRLRAALDVTDPEPLPAEHPLWDAPNLLLTPHVGGNVRGFDDRAATLIAAQIDRYLAGEPLRNQVSGEY